MSRDVLTIYKSQLSRFPPLSAEEESDLFRRFLEFEDREAGSLLIASNLRLVIRIVARYSNPGCMEADLIQEGNVGLVKALGRFDPSRGIRFSCYASFWIRAYVMKFIMDNWGMVKLGTTRAQRRLFYNLGREKYRLESMGLAFDAGIISQRMEVSRSQVIEMAQRMEQREHSLDAVYNGQTGLALMDAVPDTSDGAEEIVFQKERVRLLRHSVSKLMPKLNSMEKDIVRLRLMAENPATLHQIGERHGLTRERVRQVESRVLARIRNYVQSRIGDFSGEWIKCA